HSRRDYPECVNDDATTPEDTTDESPSDSAEAGVTAETAEAHVTAETAEAETRAAFAVPERAHAYSERLYAAWWLWLMPTAGAILLASSVNIGYPDLPAWLPYVVVLPVAVITMLSARRTNVMVVTSADEPELRVGQARLPLRFIGAVEIIDKEHKQAVLGPEFDPAAFLVHRASIGPLVQLELTDPADNTPYWVFSTRHPERVLGALGVGVTTSE